MRKLGKSYVSSAINWTRHREMKITKAQIRSYLKCESGCSLYIVSRCEFRYHMVIGLSSFGGPKMSQSEQVFSGGSRLDSIIAMLCKGNIIYNF